MKKSLIFGLCICLVGCTEKATSSVIQTSEPVVKKDTIWFLEPNEDFDTITSLSAGDYERLPVTSSTFGEITLSVETEKTGVSWNWYSNATVSNIVVVEQNGKQGIYSIDGKEIYPISVVKTKTPFSAGITAGIQKDASGKEKIVYGYADSSKSLAYIFSSDFSEVKEVPIDEFDYQTLRDTTTNQPYLALQDGVLGIAGMSHNENGNQTGWVFEPYTPIGMSENMVLPVIDIQMNVQSYCICSPTGEYIIGINQDLPYRKGSYVNGKYVIADSNYATVVDAKTGVGIAVQYQNAKYFEEGYLPIKKSGKWGYVNQYGEEVTDFIFEDVSVLNDGKAWVKIDGKYGILSFTEIMEKEPTHLNYGYCMPSDEDPISTLTVHVANLTIRSKPQTSASLLGLSHEGSQYPVYEKQTADGYTWYRISESAWVACDGTWATEQEN